PEDQNTHQAVLTAATDTDTHPNVRTTALQVLAANFPDVAWPVLCEYTKSDQPADMRVSVIKLLALLWPKEPESVTLIRVMEQHDDEIVRRTAGEALALLEQRPRSAASQV
ncbi:HEAT repeat domain-containing protein, partial [Kitasatospora sp. NPDC059973]|uniref:HEAT repeat domain-containing protein n=1 Tax=Kitasatospora sp. NPDC059973 TaxID=3347020 RepID=UPI0036805707